MEREEWGRFLVLWPTEEIEWVVVSLPENVSLKGRTISRSNCLILGKILKSVVIIMWSILTPFIDMGIGPWRKF